MFKSVVCYYGRFVFGYYMINLIRDNFVLMVSYVNIFVGINGKKNVMFCFMIDRLLCCL